MLSDFCKYPNRCKVGQYCRTKPISPCPSGRVCLRNVALSITLITCFFLYPVEAAKETFEKRDSFEKGKLLLEQQQLKEAEAVWMAKGMDERYSPIAYILLARSYRLANNVVKSESLYREVLEKFPKSIYSPLAKSELVESMIQQGKPEAIPLLNELIREADTKSKPRFILSLGQILRRLGHTSDALEQYKKLYIHFPASIEGLRAAEVLDYYVIKGLIKMQPLSQPQLTERAKRLYQAGRFDLAGEVYDRLLKEQPSNMSLIIKRATCLYKDRKNEQAILLLRDLVKTNPPLSIRLEAQYLLSRLYWRLDRDNDFESSCKELINSGNERLKKIGLFNLGTCHFEKKRFEAARTYYDKLIKMGADAKTAFQVRWRLAWIAYLTRNYVKSAQQFQELKTIANSPDLLYSCLYWQGRSLLRLKKDNEAVQLFQEICERSPRSYYGYESARILKDLNIVPKSSRQDTDSFPDSALKSYHLSNPLIQHAVQLQKMKLHEFALINLNALPPSLQAEPAVGLLRARSAYLLGQYAKARAALYQAFGQFVDDPPRNAPKEFVEIAFPRVHYEHMLSQARKHSIDPNLAWSMIRQESLYDHGAISPAGAVGLMQVMPDSSGLKAVTSAEAYASVLEHLLDPHKNLDVGLRILKQNLTNFRGNIVLAVASYNADIKKVKAWEKTNGRLTPDEFVEMIPYQETRLYVKRVLAGYQTYRILHGQQSLAELW